MSYANNKGADQPAHPRSLISAIVFRCLDSIISRFYSRNFKTLASFCGCAGRFVSGLVGNSRRHVLSCRGSALYHSRVIRWTVAQICDGFIPPVMFFPSSFIQILLLLTLLLAKLLPEQQLNLSFTILNFMMVRNLSLTKKNRQYRGDRESSI